MKIELSKEQYQCLVRLVMAGNWLINSHRAGDEILEEYEEMEQYILSLAKQFDAEDIASVSKTIADTMLFLDWKKK